MYEGYWQFSAKPFENQFHDSFYYPSESHQAALLKLRYSLENGRSVAALCGPTGIGKSFILHQLRQQLPEFINRVITVSYSALPPEQLISYIAHSLEPDSDRAVHGLASAVQCVEQSFKKNHKEGGKTLIVIDEAEWLDGFGSLETLRLILNLATVETTGRIVSSLSAVRPTDANRSTGQAYPSGPTGCRSLYPESIFGSGNPFLYRPSHESGLTERRAHLFH